MDLHVAVGESVLPDPLLGLPFVELAIIDCRICILLWALLGIAGELLLERLDH